MRRIRVIVPLLLFFTCSSESRVLETIDAIVNNEVILSGEVNKTLMMYIRNNNLNLTRAQIDGLRQNILNSLIDHALISQEVQSRLDKEEQDRLRRQIELMTNYQMDQLRNQFQDARELQTYLDARQSSWEEIRQYYYKQNYKTYIRDSIALQVTRRKVPEPTPEEIERFKKANPNFQPSEKLEVAHIQLNVPPDASSEQEMAVRQRAQELALRARAGENFDMLVQQFSENRTTKLNGGKLEPFNKGQLEEAFDQLFDLNRGEISDPIRTRVGYHVVRVLAKNTLEEYVWELKKREALQEWIQELRAKANIQIQSKNEVVADPNVVIPVIPNF